MGTAARHGPVDGERGPVIGVVLTTASLSGAVYLSGDTVWYEGVAAVGQRFTVHVALLFMGAARVVEVGPAVLTFTAAEAVEAARTFAKALILPLHYEGWAHFTEARQDIARTFAAAGLERRLCWLEPGRPLAIVE